MACPYAFSLTDLQSTPLNGTKQMNSGCGPNISGAQDGSGQSKLIAKGMGWPQNGEFEWGGLGDSCSMPIAVWNYGCEGSSIGGKRGTVKRVAYNADKTACCTQQPSGGLYNGNTCDPAFSSSNYSNKQCDQSMQTYCTQGTNIVTDPNCVTWKNVVGNGNSYVEAAMKSYCASGDNITSSTCNNWLSANQPSEQAWYDQQVAAYCAVHPTLTTGFCGCFNLPSDMVKGNLSALAIKPSCYVQSCSPGTGAYRTVNMMEDAKHCAPINICNQTINATMTNAQIAALNQTCNIYAAAYAGAEADATAAALAAASAAAALSTSSGGDYSTSSKTTNATSSSNAQDQMVGIVVTVVAICFLTSMVVYIKKKK